MRYALISCFISTALLATTSAAAQSYAQPPTYPSYAPSYGPSYAPSYAQAQPSQGYAPYNSYPAYGQQGAPAVPAAADSGGGSDGSDGSGLIIGGSITFGSFYLFSALSMAGLGKACDAAASAGPLGGSLCDDADTALGYIPLVGPFVAMGELGDSEIAIWPVQVGLIALGIGQLTGVGLLIGGAAKAAGDGEPAPVSVQPTFGPTGGSVALTTRF